jgi:hypothetical protein
MAMYKFPKVTAEGAEETGCFSSALSASSAVSSITAWADNHFAAIYVCCMRVIDARRILSADRRGSSWPVLVETDDGILFTKLRGAAQGTGALVAEVIVAELAESLGLRVPVRSLVRFAEDLPSDDENDELADLLRASAGVNLGFQYLDGADGFAPAADVARVSEDEAAKILWLDGLTTNPDRTARNPNLLWRGGELWLIDHGAALGFQYGLPQVENAAARRPYTLREAHLLESRGIAVPSFDEALAALLTPEAIRDAVSSVPNEFLQPLLVAADESLTERRASYVDFLTRRLEAPRPFLTRELAAPTPQRGRGRPEWLARRT